MEYCNMAYYYPQAIEVESQSPRIKPNNENETIRTKGKISPIANIEQKQLKRRQKKMKRRRNCTVVQKEMVQDGGKL